MSSLYNRTQIQCFIQVVECGSFTRASNALNMTTTAVSKQVKRLEARLGEQLLQRTTRLVSVTEMGALFYKRCKVIEEDIHDLEHYLESIKETPQGELTVLVSTITSKQAILQHIHSFLTLYPRIHLNLVFSEEDSDVARQEFDVLVGFPEIPPATDALKHRALYQVNNILCASHAFATTHGLPKRPEELPNYPFLSHTLRKPAHYLPLANGTELYCGKPIVYMNNFDALNHACLAGMGLFLTGDSLVAPWLKQGKLVQVLPDYQFRRFNIYLFYRAYDYELPKIKHFIDFFTDKLRGCDQVLS